MLLTLRNTARINYLCLSFSLFGISTWHMKLELVKSDFDLSYARLLEIFSIHSLFKKAIVKGYEWTFL